MPATECDSCHTEIGWAEKTPVELTEYGRPKMIPVDAASIGDPAGRIEIWQVPVIPLASGNGHAPAWLGRYLRKGEVPAPGHTTAVTHFATCPQANQWRRRSTRSGGS